MLWWGALPRPGTHTFCADVDVVCSTVQEKVCPAGTVPCIVDEGVVLWESSVLVEYIEEKFKGVGPALVPADPKLAAFARMAVKFIDGGLSAVYGALMNKGMEHGRLMGWSRLRCRCVESMMSFWC